MEAFHCIFKSQFKLGFAKVVVARAGRLHEWSQGELRLYYQPIKFAKFLGLHYKYSLSHSSNGVSQRWPLVELVAYKSGRKESFDCTINQSNLRNLSAHIISTAAPAL